MENINYYGGNKNHPQHISVGAVVFNDKKQICANKIEKEKIIGYLAGYEVDKVKDINYLLMRETLHPNETLEQALHRGLLEEFGIKAKMIDYIGSIEGHFFHEGVKVQKTTLYFICELIEEDKNLAEDDIEGQSENVWLDIEDLIEKMNEQCENLDRTDLNEGSILERAKKYL